MQPYSVAIEAFDDALHKNLVLLKSSESETS